MVISAGLAAADILHEGLPAGPGLLLEDRDGRVYVAVLGSGGIVARSTPDDAGSWEVLGEGRVQGLQIAPDGEAWMALDDEVQRYPRQGGEPVSRTSSFLLQGSPGPLLATRWGDVWCAGCGAVRRGDAMFEATPFSPPGWEITPVCDDPFGNVWAVAEDGQRRDIAVLTDQHPHGWQRLDLPADQLAGSWQGAATDDAGFVWVALEASVLRVDPRSSDPRSFANPVDARITAIARGGGQILVGFADGSLRELTVDADGPPAWQAIQAGGDGPVQALLHARSGSLWVLRAGQVERLADIEMSLARALGRAAADAGGQPRPHLCPHRGPSVHRRRQDLLRLARVGVGEPRPRVVLPHPLGHLARGASYARAGQGVLWHRRSRR